MEIIKIIGIGLITLIITIILKEYRKDFAIFAVLIGGAIILYISLDTLTRNYSLHPNIKRQLQHAIYLNFAKNHRNLDFNGIRSQHLQR